MKRPAVFFDRDNTLIISDGYLGDPEKVVLMEGAGRAVARARRLGYVTVIISNQSGVARGLFGEQEVHAVNRRIDELLHDEDPAAIIDRHEFCPHHPEAIVEKYRQDSERRKPKPGMILASAEALALDLSRSWVIGDAPRDIEAGQAAGCRTILLRPANVAASPAAEAPLQRQPDYIASTLAEAVDFIERTANERGSSGNSAQRDEADHGQTPVRPDAPTAPNPPAAGPPAPAPQPATAAPPHSPSRLEQLVHDILLELRKREEQAAYSDFSVSRLMAGIVQVLALAVLFLSYLYRNDNNFIPTLLVAIYLQTLTVALLIMGKQK